MDKNEFKKPEEYKNINSSSWKIIDMDNVEFKKPEAYKNINSSLYKTINNDGSFYCVIQTLKLY